MHLEREIISFKIFHLTMYKILHVIILIAASKHLEDIKEYTPNIYVVF